MAAAAALGWSWEVQLGNTYAGGACLVECAVPRAHQSCRLVAMKAGCAPAPCSPDLLGLSCQIWCCRSRALQAMGKVAACQAPCVAGRVQSA